MWKKSRIFVAKYNENEANNDCYDGALLLYEHDSADEAGIFRSCTQ
jgi:hypothetical protein